MDDTTHSSSQSRIDENEEELTQPAKMTRIQCTEGTGCGRGQVGRGRGGRGRGGRGRGGGGRGGRGRGRGSRGRGGRGRGGSNKEHGTESRTIDGANRDEKMKTLITNMSTDEVRDVLFRVVDRQPGLLFDLLEKEEGPSPGYHPLPSSTTPSWCTCNHCREMPTAPERVCCKQAYNKCISTLDDFATLVLHEGVLALARRYRQDVLVFPEEQDIVKANRHAAYRQFVLWRHGRLGSGVRRVLPSCCVWRIRDRFPDAYGQYRGFIPSILS